VGGTGPLFARRPALAPNNTPAFGSLWRLYTVHLPASSKVGIFLPPGFESWRARLTGLDAPAVTWQFAHPEDAAKYGLKVAMDKSCFASEAALAGCRWLDSQAALEENLPTALAPTGITVTCPFVSFAGKPVPTP
jgi:hypothetical protein